MSEQNPKSEADQVLDAVKRLISAPSAPARKTPTPNGQTTPKQAEVDERLLLTPSLRVGDQAEPDPVATVDEDQALVDEGHSLEDRIAELEAAVSGQDTEFEPDGSELVDNETPRRFVFQHTPIDQDPAPVMLPPSARAKPAVEPEIEKPDPVESATVAEPEAIKEPTLAREPNVPETIAPKPEPIAVAPDPVEPPEEEPEPIPLRPDLSEVNAFDPGPAPEPSARADADDTPLAQVDLGDDIEIDEHMLRDIVSEIVRSELQGELGERITRNVRKLVRREIHRAIMTRDFS